MPKEIYCAECGSELTLIHKALPKQKRTIMIILPHTCPEEHPEFLFKDINDELIPKKDPAAHPSNLDSVFDKFKFVKKINDLNKSPNSSNAGLGDKRPKEDLRPTEAPSGVLDAIDQGKGKES